MEKFLQVSKSQPNEEIISNRIRINKTRTKSAAIGIMNIAFLAPLDFCSFDVDVLLEELLAIAYTRLFDDN